MPVALITGATGGLGTALTDAFQKAGWQVAAGVHTRQPEEREGGVRSVPLDVTQSESCEAAVQQVLAEFGCLDCLVNNAGVNEDQVIGRLSESAWDRIVGVNLDGAMRCARAALPDLIRQRRGHIINISSFAARHGPGGQAAYAAAKAGLLGLTQALSREVGHRNVQVNAVLPGVLRTAMTAGLPLKRLEELIRANVLHRLNSLPEVASFVVFLAGMRDVSGQVFQLDSRVGRWT